MIKLQSHIKPPTARRKASEPTKAEAKAFDAYSTAYRRCYGCRPERVAFDSVTRYATFKTAITSNQLTAKRCNELTRQLNCRRIQ